MTGYTYIIGAGIAVAIGYCIWRLYKRKANIFANIDEDIVDGTLHMEDIVNYFKSQQIAQGQDTPFMADGDCEEFRKMLHAPYPHKKDGYHTIFIGVYNEPLDNVNYMKLIHAQDLDPKIVELLGGEHLVVLS